MDNLLQITKTEINVGLKKEYKLFQISDAHIAYTDEKSSKVDIDDNARSHVQWNQLKYEFAEQFGELCDERYKYEAHYMLELLMNRALELGADALVLSGDIMDRVTDSNIRYMKEKLNAYPIRYIYCPGNHAHHDEYGEKRNMYSRFEGLIENPEFDVFEFDEFNVITIDNGNKQITSNQILHFKEELNKGKKILLVLHAPLKLGKFAEIMSEKIVDYFFMGAPGDCENAFELLNLIKENDNKIIAVLAGHIHGSVEYPITDKLTQYTTSSALIGQGREIIIK